MSPPYPGLTKGVREHPQGSFRSRESPGALEMQLQAASANSEQGPVGNARHLSNEQVRATMETKASSITDGNQENRRRFGQKGGMEGSGRHWEPDTGWGKHSIYCLSTLCW